MDSQLDTLTQARRTLIDLAIRFGPRLVVALLVLVVGVLASRWARRSLHRTLRRLELEPPVRVLLVRVARVLAFGPCVSMALQNLRVELLLLIAGLRVVGAGLALATHGLLSNAAAGLTIVFTKPYRVGEYAGIIGIEGQVESITHFSTTLLHTALSRVVVPNR